MRLAHKRKVQMKLQKQLKATVITTANKTKEILNSAASITEPMLAEAKPTVSDRAKSVSLTPKQQQVLDIVLKQPQGINSKSIGIEAGQEEAKAASWATGALKKLLEENLVEKIQLSGNKVHYKAI
ncbi:MarR family transcriptional regulator [Vibrio sp. TH_r3]|uniref:MarR family transcriptional regulator n=1 Tax=Vibrio sp. TH_r3 TaxID=3082084 RepID=UPI0029533E51|nr:MarR family transcriptional regulator [Vibrio sp. TH_r3]MDV7102841.1 MarR family transcriptional regulator [Vibrio sp. TH_r3]